MLFVGVVVVSLPWSPGAVTMSEWTDKVSMQHAAWSMEHGAWSMEHAACSIME